MLYATCDCQWSMEVREEQLSIIKYTDYYPSPWDASYEISKLWHLCSQQV